jgi:hypothetical protein
MFSKYLGVLYYGLPPSDILGPSDLDRMKEPLPVASTP